jgi:hypothetical protein
MRPLLLSVMLLLTFVASNAQFTRKSYNYNGTTIWFYEYRTPGLPASYKYTTIISLGGVGQQGDGSVQSMQDHLAEDGLPKLVKNGMTLKFTIAGQQHGFLLLVPQLPLSYSQWDNLYTDGMIEYATNTYNSGNPSVQIDPNKIFLTGFSLGGGGVWKYISSTTGQASKLAGALPSYGSNDGNHSNMCVAQQARVAVWAYHADGDQLISSNITKQYINEINACSPLIPARATIFPDGAHGGWNDRMYSDTTGKWHDPSIYEWMLGVSRSINAVSNQVPVNNALAKRLTDVGTSITINSPIFIKDIRLDGSASFDPDDIITDYQWTKLSGPETYFTNYTIDGNGYPTSEQRIATIVNYSNGGADWMQDGTYTFRLVVKDYKGQSASKNVSVIVQTPAGNLPPGLYMEDKNIGASTTSLFYEYDGKTFAERDIGGFISQRAWRQVSGPSTLSFTNPTQASTTINGFANSGIYQVAYKITDDGGASTERIVNIIKAGGAVLPVTMSYFKGKNLNDHNLLSWATTAEINNDRFEILRSNDGVGFTLLGTIAGTNNHGGSAYNFDDATPLKGANYYRLKQIDKDGRSSLSKVVRIDNTHRTIAIERYPNPANSILTVTVEGNTSKNIGVSIADMQGRIVEQQQWKKENLLLRKDISVAKLQNGLYQVILTFDDGRKEVASFVKY